MPSVGASMIPASARSVATYSKSSMWSSRIVVSAGLAPSPRPSMYVGTPWMMACDAELASAMSVPRRSCVPAWMSAPSASPSSLKRGP